MRIEASLKHFSPKSMMITDSPRATFSESHTGTDVMAAIGMCQAKAGFGFSAYLGKAGISNFDREKAAELLAAYADKTAPALVRKAAGEKMNLCMVVIAKLAYNDYARSAGDYRTCMSCKGKGVLSTLKYVVTHPGCGEPGTAGHTPPKRKLQSVEYSCGTCKGKGVLSSRCRCNGTGKVRDIEASKAQGKPVEKDCERCKGLGYQRQPASVAYAAVKMLLPDLSQSSWSRNWKPFYELLISKCFSEESNAERIFMNVTR